MGTTADDDDDEVARTAAVAIIAPVLERGRVA